MKLSMILPRAATAVAATLIVAGCGSDDTSTVADADAGCVIDLVAWQPDQPSDLGAFEKLTWDPLSMVGELVLDDCDVDRTVEIVAGRKVRLGDLPVGENGRQQLLIDLTN